MRGRSRLRKGKWDIVFSGGEGLPKEVVKKNRGKDVRTRKRRCNLGGGLQSPTRCVEGGGEGARGRQAAFPPGADIAKKNRKGTGVAGRGTKRHLNPAART